MYKRILVATDGSNLSKKAVRAAFDMAAVLGAQIHVVRVVPKFVQAFLDSGYDASSKDEIKQAEKSSEQKAQKLLDALVNSFNTKQVEVKTTIVRSYLVSDAILRVARKSNIDLIVMASHGRHGLRRLLLGSETLQVLTHSDIPVLVVR
jgi:nucleotide-binding universal stress UspA family protein